MSLVYTVRPISDRTPFRGEYENSQFTAGWSDTLDVLDRELWHLDAEHVVIEVDVPERGIRVDGQMRADAKVTSPAVRLAFDSKHGPLQYATDRFVRPSWQAKGAQEDWQHNLRAIALGLEALRRVDRYGITRRGEQYTGWKALPAGAGAPIAMPAAMNSDEAARLLIELSGFRGTVTERHVNQVINSPEQRTQLYRQAVKKLHPDNGGDRALFDRLQEARTLLDGGAR